MSTSPFWLTVNSFDANFSGCKFAILTLKLSPEASELDMASRASAVMAMGRTE
jgi:hypothetical protein